MTEQSVIDQPGQEVVLDRPHRGDVRCRILRIGRKGSLFGNVVADEVWVAGRFDGIAYAGQFIAAAGAKVFGAVNTNVIGIKPGASVQAHIGRAFPAQGFGRVGGLREEEVLRSVEKEVAEAVAAALPATEGKSLSAASAQSRGGASVPAAPFASSASREAVSEIEEAFAPLSMESLANAVESAVRQSRRTALPSLV